MEEEQGKKERDEGQEGFECPLGHFFNCLRKGAGQKSEFRRHLYRSKMEFLMAIRSLIDERIQDLEMRSQAREKKVVKVAVE